MGLQACSSKQSPIPFTADQLAHLGFYAGRDMAGRGEGASDASEK